MNHQAIQHPVKIKADAEGNPPSRIHLMTTGHWHAPWHGNFEMTTEDLQEMVDHFNDGVGTVEGSKKLPVNYGHDITGKAAGWITKLTVEADGKELWGDVEWTKEGDRMLREGELRYISPEWNPRSFPYQDPEDEDSWLDNVFTGAGLTNIPLFKKLKPIMASLVAPKVKQASVVTASDSNNNNGEKSMDLEELRSKKPEDLSDEQKKFVEEHKADLTDEERETFGLDDGDANDTQDNDGEESGGQSGSDSDRDDNTGTGGDQTQPPSKTASRGAVSISADRLAKLEADAAAGLKASQELEQSKVNSLLASAVSKGQIKTGDTSRWSKVLLASGAQRTEIESLITGLPVNEELGKEHGDAGKEETSASAELTERATKMASESNGKVRYSEATKSILASDKDLRERINAERANQTNRS